MKDLSNTVETLAKKAETLISAYRQSQDRNELLVVENAKLKDKVKGLDERIQQLTDENKVLKMAAAVKGDEEVVAETKRRISQMVREIDRCIARLND